MLPSLRSLSMKKVNSRLGNLLINEYNFNKIVLIYFLCLYPLLVIPSNLNMFMTARYMSLVVLSMLALFIIVHKRMLTFHASLVPLIIFLVFMMISSIKAENTKIAFLGLFDFFELNINGKIYECEAYRFTGFTTYFFCAILFYLAANEPDYIKLTKAFASSSIIVSMITIINFLKVDFLINIIKTIKINHLAATFGNTNFLATYLILALTASICFYLLRRKSVWLSISGIIYAAFLITKTRGAWLAFGIVFILILIHTLRKCNDKKNWYNVLKLVIVFALISAFLLIFNNGDLLKRVISIPNEIKSAVQLDDSAGSSRMYIWKEAFKVFLRNWTFGVGPDHLVYEKIMMPGENAVFADKVHNIYLEIAATMGVFTLISYIIFLGYFLRKWKNEMGFTYFVMILAYLIQGFFNIDVIMVMPIFWIILGFNLNNSKSVEFIQHPKQ